MSEVARSLDVPMKIMVPSSYAWARREVTMLGLGDIALPGIFVAFGLRFDFV